jgi:hypothetical protein
MNATYESRRAPSVSPTTHPLDWMLDICKKKRTFLSK